MKMMKGIFKAGRQKEGSVSDPRKEKWLVEDVPCAFLVGIRMMVKWWTETVDHDAGSPSSPPAFRRHGSLCSPLPFVCLSFRPLLFTQTARETVNTAPVISKRSPMLRDACGITQRSNGVGGALRRAFTRGQMESL